MNAMTAPDVWSGQDRALTVFELRDDGYRQIGQVTGEEAFRAVRPFPVAVTPSALVPAGR